MPALRPRRDRPRGAALWLWRVGALALWSFGVQLAATMLVAAHHALAAAMFLTLAAALFVLWYVARRGYPGELRRRAVLRLRGPGRSLVWLVPTAVCIIAMDVATLGVMIRFFHPPERDLGRIYELFQREPYGRLAFAALGVLVAPLTEEFVFRGWLQRSLERRWPPARAIVVTALLFAAVHFDWFGAPQRFVFGLAAGTLAYASGSIVPSVLLHVANNAALLLGAAVPALGDDAAAEALAHRPDVFAGALATLLVSLLLLWLVLRRAVRERRHAPGALVRRHS